jgi:hypothetical protein
LVVLMLGILKLQDSKRDLAKAALSGDAVKNATALTLNDLLSKYTQDIAERSIPAIKSRARFRLRVASFVEGHYLGYTRCIPRRLSALSISRYDLVRNPDFNTSPYHSRSSRHCRIHRKSSQEISNSRETRLQDALYCKASPVLADKVHHVCPSSYP